MTNIVPFPKKTDQVLEMGVVPECVRCVSLTWTEQCCQINPSMIQVELALIRDYLPDNGLAHFRENALHLAVLEAIAEGRCDDPRACAAAAAETKKIDFGRWYA